jgi:hypothetical protein
MPPAGFEDRDDHRTACASVWFSLLTLPKTLRIAILLERNDTVILGLAWACPQPFRGRGASGHASNPPPPSSPIPEEKRLLGNGRGASGQASHLGLAERREVAGELHVFFELGNGIASDDDRAHRQAEGEVKRFPHGQNTRFRSGLVPA